MAPELDNFALSPCQPSLFTLTTFICQWQAYAKLSTPAAWVRGAPNFLIFLSTPDMFNPWPSSAFPDFFPGFRSLTGILLRPKYPRKFQECWQPCVWGLLVAGGIMRYRDLCTRRLSANRLYPMEPQSRARSPRNHNNIRTWVFFIGFLWLCAFSQKSALQRNLSSFWDLLQLIEWWYNDSYEILVQWQRQ